MKQEIPLVSIIIPIYNSDSTIVETLNSIKNQTYENLEVILVDDGSTDKSSIICQEFCKTDYRFKFYSRDRLPKGANTCRNIGFNNSAGDYIQFIDSDDLISKNKIENQIFTLNQTNDRFSLCFCRWVMFESKIPLNINDVPQLNYKNYENPIDFLIDIWNNGYMTIPACWLIPRRIIVESGLWDESLLINQDGEFYSRLILKSTKILYDNEGVAYYRKPGNKNISKQISYPHLRSKLYSYKCYQKNMLAVEDTHRVRLILAKNFSWFIYSNDNDFKDLVLDAKNSIKILGFNAIPIVGPIKFRITAHIIGFENAIVITRIARKMYSLIFHRNNSFKIKHGNH